MEMKWRSLGGRQLDPKIRTIHSHTTSCSNGTGFPDVSHYTWIIPIYCITQLKLIACEHSQSLEAAGIVAHQTSIKSSQANPRLHHCNKRNVDFPCVFGSHGWSFFFKFSIRQPVFFSKRVAQHTQRALNLLDIRFSAVAVGAATVASQRRGLRKACVAVGSCGVGTKALIQHYCTRHVYYACIFAVGMASDSDMLIHIYIYTYICIQYMYLYLYIYMYVAFTWTLFQTPLSLYIYIYIIYIFLFYLYTSQARYILLYFAFFPFDIAPRFRRAPGQLLCVSGPKDSQKIRILDVLGYIRLCIQYSCCKTDCFRVDDELYKWNFQLNPQVWDLESNMW